MEREPQTLDRQTVRAIRSLAWNRALLPIIEDRIYRAEQLILAYLTIQGTPQACLGAYEVELVDDSIRITQLQTDDWAQIPLPNVSDTFLIKAKPLSTEF